MHNNKVLLLLLSRYYTAAGTYIHLYTPLQYTYALDNSYRYIIYILLCVMCTMAFASFEQFIKRSRLYCTRHQSYDTAAVHRLHYIIYYLNHGECGRHGTDCSDLPTR